MKLNILTSFLIASACIGSLRAAPVYGTQLEIGPAGSNQVSDSYSQISGAIGSNNNVDGDGSLAIGMYNHVWMKSLAVGYFNAGYGSYGLSAGDWNTNDGDSCMLVGSFNYATMDYEAGQSSQCLLAGRYNTSGADVSASFVLGTNNVVAGDWNSSIEDYNAVDSSSTMGHGLVNKWSYSTVLGTYNASNVPYTAGLLFAIGNGTDATHRSNALEVYADGKIKMPRQGDVLMGEFGNTEP